MTDVKTLYHCFMQSRGVTTDTRRCESGMMFFALRGENFDGNEYALKALEAGADIIMLDNMSVEDMQEAVKLTKGKAQTECSGNVTKENIAKLINIGVDFISSGALTHSAPILDLSLKNLHAV